MSGAQEVSRFRSEMKISERKLVWVAILLAILEKFTSMLGKLNFIWATTVLLGGFASYLVEEDFSAVSIILVAEGIRIFGRRGELHTSSTYLYAIIYIFSLLIQDVSAVICFCLSWFRLKSAEHGPSDQARNRNVALKLFYSVSIVESSLIVLGLVLRILCGLGGRRVMELKDFFKLHGSQTITLDRFFNHIISRCVSGSIFDYWKMTSVWYSVELLQCSKGDEQLRGARLLSRLVKENQRALERLRSIGTMRSVVEMLIDMLNWDSNEFPDKGIRVAAAEIISNLVGIGQNRTLVMAAPDSMESIASLLYDGNQVEINSSQNRTQSSPEYPYSDFSKAGLSILKLLASDHDNRAKMGSNRGLLLKIITLTESNTLELDSKKLAIETLTSIARDQEFREIIGGTDGVLHNLLSLFFADIYIHNEDERQLVSTAGEALVWEFVSTVGEALGWELVSTAGEALGFLSLENHHNCEILMNFPYLIEDLNSALNNPDQGTYAARILRNLYAYLEAKSVELKAKGVELEANSDNLNKIRAASAEVVRLVMEKKEAHQEAAIGLAAQIFKFPSQEDYKLVFGEQGGPPSLILKLREVLQQNASPSKELPNIRRFSILLLIAVMKMDEHLTIRNESQLQMELMSALEGAMNTTSVLESYSTFSGTIGLTSHRMSIPFLAHSAMELLHPVPTRRHTTQHPTRDTSN